MKGAERRLLRVDDVVVYSMRHWTYLSAIGRTPLKTSRTDVRGRVTEAGVGFVRVFWNNAKKVTTHYPEHVERWREDA